MEQDHELNKYWALGNDVGEDTRARGVGSSSRCGQAEVAAAGAKPCLAANQQTSTQKQQPPPADAVPRRASGNKRPITSQRSTRRRVSASRILTLDLAIDINIAYLRARSLG